MGVVRITQVLCVHKKEKKVECLDVTRQVENVSYCSGSPSVLRGPLECREVWLGEHRNYFCSPLKLQGKDIVLLYCNNLHNPFILINPLTPNDPYRGRTAPLTS